MAIDKELLLVKRMNELGLGGVFNRYFLLKNMSQDQVITLRQFFELNTDLRRNIIKGIRCISANVPTLPKQRLLLKSSKSFLTLRTFLIDHGFTSDDWGMLLPKGNGGRVDYGKLPHDKLLRLPVFQVTDVKAVSRPMEYISRIFFGEETYGSQILVKDILGITGYDIIKKLPKKTKKNTKVFCTLKKIQIRLERYGFDKKYPFMKISL